MDKYNAFGCSINTFTRHFIAMLLKVSPKNVNEVLITTNGKITNFNETQIDSVARTFYSSNFEEFVCAG